MNKSQSSIRDSKTKKKPVKSMKGKKGAKREKKNEKVTSPIVDQMNT